jgi:hypothetical protein
MDDTPSGLVLFGICFGVIATFVVLLWLVNYLKGWRPSHMSSAPERQAVAAGTPPVHVPVLDTGSTARTSAAPAGGTDVAAPDTTAAEGGTGEWEAPRISTRLSDTETIALLAAQRGADGKHRYSANQIHGLVGGSRAAVLDQVRALRDGAPPVFRPLTPEQQQVRHQLQLDQR